MIFNKVLSVGPSCHTAYQIREFIDQEEAYVFDWLIAPYTRVAEVLTRHFANFIDPSALKLIERPGADAHVLDETSGLEFHHDFKNDASFMTTFEGVKRKYEFLIQRTLDLFESGSSILFVHDSQSPDEGLMIDEVLKKEFPSLPYRLLGVLPDERCADAPADTETLAFRGMSKLSDDTWQDRTPRWHPIFLEFLSQSIERNVIKLRSRSAA